MADSGDRAAELDEQDVSALKEMSEWWQSSKVGRRAVIGASAAGIGAALTGGYGAGTAAAQPTGDEGQVGQETDRVEAWVSEIDANEFSLGSDGPATSFDDIGGGLPNVEIVESGDDWQAAIDAVHHSYRRSGVVKVTPQRAGDIIYDLSNTSLPVIVKSGVTLDVSNTNLRPPQDQDIFDLREEATVIGNNCYVDDPGDGLSGGNVFVADGSNSDAPGSETPAQVIGYPTVRANGYSSIVYLTTDGTNPIYSCLFEVAGYNGPRMVHVNNQSGSSNAINVNTFRLLGSFADSGNDMVTFTGDSIIANNEVVGVVQVKDGSRVIHVDRGRRNVFDGFWVDTQNTTSTPFSLPGTARGGNEIRNRWRGIDSSDANISSGHIEFVHAMPEGHSPIPQDLTSVDVGVGDLREGYQHNHNGADGSNTNAAGPAWYDGSNWVSLVDGGTIV